MTQNVKMVLWVVVLVIIIASFGWWYIAQKSAGPVVPVSSGISVAFPKSGDVITSPVTISGTVTGNGWAGFEGQVGGVSLLDSKGSELASGALTATTDWMVLPTQFSLNLSFTSPGNGSGSLVFRNENPSGDPARDKTLVVPVVFK